MKVCYLVNYLCAMNKRFVKLEPEEIITLQEGYKNVAHHQFKQRCHALLMSHQGEEMARLATVFSVSLATISNCNGGPVVYHLGNQRDCGLTESGW